MQRDPHEIYLDCNATTPVLPEARRAALEVMEDQFGNPSSVHLSGLRARSILENTRKLAAQFLRAQPEQIIFTSGATEGIQVAVFSALQEGLKRYQAGDRKRTLILYGATEHKAVPEAIKHWNQLLGNPFRVEALPVDSHGRIKLDVLASKVGEALLVCTMAANNETGAIQDLEAIEAVLRKASLGAVPSDQGPLWLVDCVQGLGKLPLDFSKFSIDYAPFSGHKLYAMKGVGFLVISKEAPLTPMTVGGGQERGLRSGTENLPGVASLGAVFDLLLRRDSSITPFRSTEELKEFRGVLSSALREVFPAVEFALAEEEALPTTLNFAVPGLSSRDLMDLFDAAGIRVSAGSACSSGKTTTSPVLDAMGFPEWRSAGAIRLSWGLATAKNDIIRAADALKRAGRALGQSCLLISSDDFQEPSTPFDGVMQLRHAGANTWIWADAREKVCVVIDPVTELSDRVQQFVQCQGMKVLAVLDTHSHADHDSCRPLLAQALAISADTTSPLGWPLRSSRLFEVEGLAKNPCAALLLRESNSECEALVALSTPGHTSDSFNYFWVISPSKADLQKGRFQVRISFCGDLVLAGGLGRTDFAMSNPLDCLQSLAKLDQLFSEKTLLCPAHDYENTFATTWGAEKTTTSSLLGSALQAIARGNTSDIDGWLEAKKQKDRQIRGGGEPGTGILCGLVQAVDTSEKTRLIATGTLSVFLSSYPQARVIDVREPHEFVLTQDWLSHGLIQKPENVPLSRFVQFCAEVLAQQSNAEAPLVFLCRSGNRSLQAVRALHRLGVQGLYSVEGGVALN